MKFIEHRGLAFACVLAPVLLGVLGNSLLSWWMTRGTLVCAIMPDLAFRLIGETTPRPLDTPLKLSGKEAQTCRDFRARKLAGIAPPPPSAITPNAATPAAAPAPRRDADSEPANPKLLLIANHVAGRYGVAYGYAFLLLVSVLAFSFGSFVVIKKTNWRVWLTVTVGFLIVTFVAAFLDVTATPLRYLAADNILARADKDAVLQFLPAADNLEKLILMGLTFGYLSVGLILAALYCASIRLGDMSTRHNLEERLFVIRIGLVLGSAILVIVVLSSRAVFDWPLSLLVESDRKALTPIADALVRKWGAIGSISLVGAFLPAISAWYLDRACYRSTLPKTEEAKKREAESEPLEIAPLSTITSIIVVLAPVLASPLFDVVKSVASSVK
jgi:hypothetical protein